MALRTHLQSGDLVELLDDVLITLLLLRLQLAQTAVGGAEVCLQTRQLLLQAALLRHEHSGAHTC